MRDAIGLVDKGVDILTFIDALSPEKQAAAKRKIADVEEKAMKEMVCFCLGSLHSEISRSNKPSRNHSLVLSS